ncbi:MAG: MEKHLA domain-containing protein [Verrucomicrobia bacterium]|nr:MEKHLA domain-containing protein [Verrucomicrobiota bacterium]
MFSGDPVPLIVRSYRHWTGENLLPSDLAESGWAEALAGLSRVVVAHDTAADPCFVYGNRAALELFEMRREDFIGMPSRLSAEPVRREERARVLEEVRVRGFSTSYSGVRVSATGKRFRIENAVLWNLVDHEGVIRGQAATFAQWSFL